MGNTATPKEALRELHQQTVAAFKADGWRGWVHNNAAGIDEFHFALGPDTEETSPIWIEASRHGVFIRGVNPSQSLDDCELPALFDECMAISKIARAIGE